MSKYYKICTIDSIGNDKEGYEFNDIYPTNYVVCLPDNPTLREVVQRMKLCGFLDRCPSWRHLDIDDSAECERSSYVISQRRNGKQLWSLNYIDDSKTFSVIEYNSGYAVRHNATGLEHWLSDGVDAVHYHNGEPIPAGSPQLIPAWEASLNEVCVDTLEAYFPDLYAIELADSIAESA